ncbi:MAG: hypothetical protein ACOC5T_04105 [Elusimicrobiota bacterium]
MEKPSARKMQNVSDLGRKKIIEKEVNEIFLLIRNAAQAGSYSRSIYFDSSDLCFECMEAIQDMNLGYDIKRNHPRRLDISWKE